MTNIDTHPYARKGSTLVKLSPNLSYDEYISHSVDTGVDDYFKCVYLHLLILHNTLLNWNSIRYL